MTYVYFCSPEYSSACNCPASPPATNVPDDMAVTTAFMGPAQSPAAKTPGIEVL